MTDRAELGHLCECGCGKQTRVAVRSNAGIGMVKGEPMRFVLGHYDRSKRRARRGEHRSPETRARISASLMGKGLGNQRARGHRWTDAERLWMRTTRRRRVAPSAAEVAASKEKQRGEKGRAWRGGIHVHEGYRKLRALGHPFADRHGYVAEHRLVMERVLGRYLLPVEVVHHLNHEKSDNRACNLVLCSSQGDHIRRHHADEISVQSALSTLRAHRPDLLAKEAR